MLMVVIIVALMKNNSFAAHKIINHGITYH